jgi:hypothetical protein
MSFPPLRLLKFRAPYKPSVRLGSSLRAILRPVDSTPPQVRLTSCAAASERSFRRLVRGRAYLNFCIARLRSTAALKAA